MAPFSSLSIMLLLPLFLCPVAQAYYYNKGRVRVTVRCAIGLKGDRIGQTDAYVKLWYGKSDRQTRLIRSNNPSWFQCFDLGYVDTTQLLKLEVWDKDPGRDDKLGACSTYMKKGTHYRSCKMNRGMFYYKFTCTGSRCGPPPPKPKPKPKPLRRCRCPGRIRFSHYCCRSSWGGSKIFERYQ